jgi:hypothetical protein
MTTEQLKLATHTPLVLDIMRVMNGRKELADHALAIQTRLTKAVKNITGKSV